MLYKAIKVFIFTQFFWITNFKKMLTENEKENKA